MRWPSLLVLLLLAAPAATAHGAPEAREIDTRILADETDNGDYGAEGRLDEGGLDVLALDVYEATLPGNATPAVVFRVIVQGGDASMDHELAIDFEANGAHSHQIVTDDLATYTSSTFDAVRGPFDVGDGHPKAVEGILALGPLGITSDQIGGITVTSRVDGQNADVMPGSWYFAGVEVPDNPTHEHQPGAYDLRGVRAWFDVGSGVEFIEPSAEGQDITITLQSNLDQMEQVVSLSATAPDGVEATLSGATAILAPGQAKNVTLTASGFGVGDVRVTATSDLGLTRILSLPLAGDPIVGDGREVKGELLPPGGSFQYRFTEPGVFDYHCHPHPVMAGQVTIVEDDPGDAPQVHIVRMVEGDPEDIATYAFTPSQITVQVNDTVVWINDGLMHHNVHGSTGVDGHGGHAGHDHGDHDHGTGDDDNSTPGPSLALLMLGLLVLVRRR